MMNWLRAFLFVTMTAPTAGLAYADYVCESKSGKFVFVLDIAGQTITQSGHDPIPFDPATPSAFPLEPKFIPELVGIVDIPIPDHLNTDTLSAFALVWDETGRLILKQNFAFTSGDPTNAFLPVEDILETTRGLLCQAEEGD